ncbi:MAG: prepilin peptidase [Candidatus Omnitrophota bacterium]
MLKKNERTEEIGVLLPLLLFLAVIGWVEFRTGNIPNVALFYAGLYFLLAGIVAGARSWWHYPVGGVLLFFITLFVAGIYYRQTGYGLFGGGTVKLLAVIGIAVGMRRVLGIALVVFLVHFLLYFLNGAFKWGWVEIPSVPIIFSGVALALLLGRLFRKPKAPSCAQPERAEPVPAGKVAPPAAVKAASKIELWAVGLIVVILGVVANRMFAGLGIGGLLRELSRLAVLVGTAVFLAGLLAPLFRKNEYRTPSGKRKDFSGENRS